MGGLLFLVFILLPLAVVLSERYVELRNSRAFKTVLRRLWLCLWALWAVIWLLMIRDYSFKGVGFVIVWPLVIWGAFNLLVVALRWICAALPKSEKTGGKPSDALLRPTDERTPF
jgi:hypothetical protein